MWFVVIVFECYGFVYFAIETPFEIISLVFLPLSSFFLLQLCDYTQWPSAMKHKLGHITKE